MSFDLCTPYQCNVCLMFKIHGDKIDSSLVGNSCRNLLSCSGCQLIKYCNSQHQKIDWPIHRNFCQAVQKIKKSFNIKHPFYVCGKPTKREEVERATIQLKYLLKNTLARNLEYQEEELTSFPAYCPVCFQFQNLKALCSRCLSQAYCTEQHKELHRQDHDKHCHFLLTYYSPYKVLPAQEDLVGDIKGKLDNFENMDLIEAFEKTFVVKLNRKSYQDLKSYQLFTYAADFSCIMTICFALRQIKVDLKSLTEYRIFILGAAVETHLWFRKIHCKLFFLLNPTVAKLNIEFIGPELVEPAEYKEFEFTFMDLKRVVKFSCYKGLFQDFCRYYPVKTHLIVVFNCGFSEFSETYNINVLEALDSNAKIKAKDTWSPGLIEILQIFDTPIVFTSFTEQEAHFDYAALQNAAAKQKLTVHIERILKVTKNPFHDLRPLRQWYTHDKEQFYYRNGYIQAISTRLEKNHDWLRKHVIVAPKNVHVTDHIQEKLPGKETSQKTVDITMNQDNAVN